MGAAVPGLRPHRRGPAPGPDAPDRVHGPGGYHDAGAGPGDPAAGPSERDAGGGAVPAAEGHRRAYVLPGDDTCTAWCSNFAPLYDIPEECATGTSNGALTYYLYRYGLVQPDRENVFIQGEHMRRSSEIRSRLTVEKGDALIRVGGRAVLSLSGEIYAD